MKPLQLASLLGAMFALSHAAAAEWFVRPAALSVYYRNSGYVNKNGVSLAAGAVFGPRAEHEVGLEGGSIDWALSASGYAGTPGFVYTTGSGHFATYFAHYRFYFGARDARIRCYLGPSVGWANFRGKLKQYRSGFVANDNLGQWLFASAGGIGVTLRLSGNAAVDIGYRYLRIDGSNPSFQHIRTEATKANVLQMGLGWLF